MVSQGNLASKLPHSVVTFDHIAVSNSFTVIFIIITVVLNENGLVLGGSIINTLHTTTGQCRIHLMPCRSIGFCHTCIFGRSGGCASSVPVVRDPSSSTGWILSLALYVKTMHLNSAVDAAHKELLKRREKNPADMPKKHNLSQFTMTSFHGNTYRFTGPLWGESTGDQ